MYRTVHKGLLIMSTVNTANAMSSIVGAKRFIRPFAPFTEPILKVHIL
jgi:hypothetical protein